MESMAFLLGDFWQIVVDVYDIKMNVVQSSFKFIVMVENQNVQYKRIRIPLIIVI